MKFSAVVLLALPAVSAAFAPSSRPAFGARSVALNAVVTGPEGKAAASAEEDLELTYKVIMAHVDSDGDAVEESVAVAEPEPVVEEEAEPEPEPIDISIPYDAAAQLAYEASDKSMAYADFKVKYEEDAVADVMAKYVDISIPYDAAARLAFESSDKSMSFDDFKVKFEDDAVADVKAKYATPEAEDAPAGDDVSIPYDAAAKLAYEASDKSTSFEDFKVKYEEETVAMVAGKKAAREAGES